MTDRTDTDALLDYVKAHHDDVPRAYVDPAAPGDVEYLVIPAGHDLVHINPEHHANQPRRPRGLIEVHDAASFVAAVQHRLAPDTDVDQIPIIYADEAHMGMAAVLNDDQHGVAGWRDHRVVLRLRPTPEWTAWKTGQGLGSQEKFAIRIEDGAPEIREPSASDMLELAQTFHATTEAKFRSGVRLADGSRQFVYDEDVKASAGSSGQVTVPETFTLAVRPFVGAEHYQVTARFRFQLRAGDLKVGYQLVRPDDVERDAFNFFVAGVSDAFDDDAALILAGPAPTQTT